MIAQGFKYLAERVRYGVPRRVGTPGDDVLFLVDGVGGFQYCVTMIRKALREDAVDMTTIMFDWQFPVPGEIFTDLMWHRRNRWMGLKLARELKGFHRAHPQSRIHLMAVSAGTGITVFACEKLKRSCMIETLVLTCPALSPTYNLAPALKTATRAYALVSRRDTVVLGLGTRLFGTVDRRFGPAAGCVGFRRPEALSDDDRSAYDRLREVRWSPDLRRDGNRGGHGSWVNVRFLRRHLMPLLHGQPLLPLHDIPAFDDEQGAAAGNSDLPPTGRTR